MSMLSSPSQAARKAAIKSFIVDFGSRNAYPLHHTRTDTLAFLALAELVQGYMDEPGDSSQLYYLGALASLQADGELRVRKSVSGMTVSLSAEAYNEAKAVQAQRDAYTPR